MLSFENTNLFPQKPKGSEKPKSKKLKRSALTALALYAAPTSDTLKQDKNTFDQRFVAAKQIKEGGITESQRRAYKPGVSELIAVTVNPRGYSHDESEFGSATILEDTKRLVSDAYEVVAQGSTARDQEEKTELLKTVGMPEELAQSMVSARNDAWKMYLGLPQEQSTFGISDYKPERSKQDKYYYKLNNFLQNYALRNKCSSEQALAMLVRLAKDPTEYNPSHPSGTTPSSRQSVLADGSSGVMGHFILSKGRDKNGYYVSYYDKWNLEGSQEGEDGLIGKPFEIYDRIYYDPKILEKSRSGDTQNVLK